MTVEEAVVILQRHRDINLKMIDGGIQSDFDKFVAKETEAVEIVIEALSPKPISYCAEKMTEFDERFLVRGRRIYSKEWVSGYIVPKKGENYLIHNPLTDETYEIENDTIGRYALLKDKNGARVFEGDICKGGFFYGVYQIVFDDEYLQFRAETANLSMGLNYYTTECSSIMNDAEVIGNIYDNPEFLEGDKND